MRQNLLIEIGVEELPAIPLLKILNKIEKEWGNILKKYRLDSNYSFQYTPRRLVISSNELPARQPDAIEEFFGPPVNIAIKDGSPTPAGLGFAKKCGVEFEELQRVTKGNKEILYYKKEIEGQNSTLLLPQMVKEWVLSMNFGKMMRWGSRNDEFIRPIRWLQVRVGNSIVDMELFGVNSANQTYLHRMVSFEPVTIEDTSKFEDILNSGAVILNAKTREEKILKDIEYIEDTNSVTVERDSKLLSEVVAITENPKALIGSFDKEFLELPPEVIITSMKEHQRYFPVFDNSGKLTNRFVVVSNAVTKSYEKVITGNERVLRPRLSDALFFYHNDLKRGLSTNGLEKIQFIDGLGTLKDKIDRERDIALRLSGIYMDKLESESGKTPLEIEELMQRAVELAKTDLLTEMVYEFTELQGLMGYYYAKALGEDPLVYNAIKEQYMPQGENDSLPSSLFASVLALSIKLDTLLGLFSVGKIPSGSKDPFALRRAVNGTIRIVNEYDIPFDITKIINLLKDLYKPFDTKKLEDFIIERIYKSIDANTSVVAAVLASGEKDINKITKKVKALNSILSQDNAKELFTTFKRVANISKDIDIKQNLKVDTSLFAEPQENKLYTEFTNTIEKEYKSYEDRLKALFALKPTLDEFFDTVLVHAEDEKLRQNRENLIASIYKAFYEIADIKEISI